MRAGRLVQDGDPRALYREPVDLFAARFLRAERDRRRPCVRRSGHTPVGRFAAPSSPTVSGRPAPPAGHFARPTGSAPGAASPPFLGEVTDSFPVIAIPGPLVDGSGTLKLRR